MMELGDPLHHELRDLLAAGVLGAPVLVQTELCHDLYLRSPPAATDWRRDPDRVGGSAFLQLAVHSMNLVAFLLQRPIIEVTALAGGNHTVFHDETTLAVARLAGDVLACFTASYATRGQSLTIRGTEGALRLDPQGLELIGARSWRGKVLGYERPGAVSAFPRESLQPAIAREAELEVHARFARWVRDGESFSCPGEMALRDLLAADAVRDSVASGATVRIAIGDGP
jgi:predicted dehydrogenase